MLDGIKGTYSVVYMYTQCVDVQKYTCTKSFFLYATLIKLILEYWNNVYSFGSKISSSLFKNK